MDWRVSGGSVTSLEEQQADFIWSIPNSIGKVPETTQASVQGLGSGSPCRLSANAPAGPSLAQVRHTGVFSAA